jgi:hypothetical protein
VSKRLSSQTDASQFGERSWFVTPTASCLQTTILHLLFFFGVCAGSFTAHHDIHVVEGLWLVNLRRLEWANISQQAAI